MKERRIVMEQMERETKKYGRKDKEERQRGGGDYLKLLAVGKRRGHNLITMYQMSFSLDFMKQFFTKLIT